MATASTYYRILCVTADRMAFDTAVALTWRRFAQVRWTFISHDDEGLAKAATEHAVVFLDCTTEQMRAASLVYEQLPQDRFYPVAFDGAIRAPWRGGTPVLGIAEVLKFLETIPVSDDCPPVIWPDGDPDLDLAQPTLAPLLPLTIQKYFPFRQDTAHVRKVVGGWSGTPLLRVAIERASDEYFLKFFADRDEFVREWDNHARAVVWLKSHVVNLHAVPSLEQSGRSQLSAFPTDSSGLSPICYQSAHVTATLKELYRDRSADFVEDAYQEVLHVLKLTQPAIRTSLQPLTALEDIGPGRNKRNAPRRMIETLRCLEYRSFINSAKAELSPYLTRCIPEHEWTSLEHALDEFLRVDQPWVAEQVDLDVGYVHGDANARNFLFNRSQRDRPDGLQFIDCGGCVSDAPLLLDLGQMESDLKIVLLGGEEAAPDYRDIDSGRLSTWVRQEREALEGLHFRHDPTSTSTSRAYKVVRRIRDRAAELSRRDHAGRAYFFYLLYWTLRKLRHTTFPHIKRILALYSACQICKNMMEWKLP